MKKKILIFGHTDLDGVGVQIIGSVYAEVMGLPYKVFGCDYGEINQCISSTLKKYKPEEIEEIIVGDISVDKNVAKKLHDLTGEGVKVCLRDHHLSAEWLNKYPWAEVFEKKNGVPYCGTYLLAETLKQRGIEDLKSILDDYNLFVETVDSWDTWKWKEDGNLNAKKLNNLFQIMGAKEFTEYILKLDMLGVFQPADLFDRYTNTLIEAYDKVVTKIAKSCKKYMEKAVFKFPAENNGKLITLIGGIIFCNSHISEVADYIFSTGSDDIDFLVIFGFPGRISFRTNKDDLPIPLGKVAEYMTGSGGGHAQAAGSIVPSGEFKKTIKETVRTLSKGKVKIMF